MSNIALYNVLTKLGVKHEGAEKAVADVVGSKEVATKLDLAKQEARLIEKIADAKNTMIVWVVGMNVAIFLGLSAVIFSVVGLLK